MNPSGDLVWNSDDQSHLFPSMLAVIDGIKDELNEPSAILSVKGKVDKEISFGEDNGWKAQDYRIFKEIVIPR